jgi:hypothetical protein
MIRRRSTAVWRCLAGAAIVLSSIGNAGPVWAAEAASGRVVLNEIMYHPTGGQDDFQFIELWNAGQTAADLSGWSLTKGVEFTFPAGFNLPPDGYTIVGRNPKALTLQLGNAVRIAGAFKGKLSHKGERIELVDASRRQVDAVKFSDVAPWPMAADGYSGSLERINPNGAGDDAFNWAGSQVKGATAARGTPGMRNSVCTLETLPTIREVNFGKVRPAQPVSVTAQVEDMAGVGSVSLRWASTAGEPRLIWTNVAMKLVSGDARKGSYSGIIPAQPEGRLVRFTVHARGTNGAERVVPAPSEPRPTYSYSTFVNTNTARVPFFQILTLGASQSDARGLARWRPGPQIRSGGNNSGWNSAVIYLEPGTNEVRTFDHVRVRPRAGGWNVDFLKDQTFEGMTQVNVIHESSHRYVLSEPLAYDLFRKAGLAAPLTQHARVWLDGQTVGYFLMVEQPNKAFLRRNGRDPDGNLYKILWFGDGVVSQHQKKTNKANGHQDIVGLIEQLNRTKGAEQWQIIRTNFNVEAMTIYYAVNMCIQNWDGFFNNHFVYHDLRPGGKWEVFPWDEDKTWGDYDGASRRYDWYEMPLTFGMNGEGGGGGGGGGFFGGSRGGFGGGWWRPPGWFSGPLLANPQFRHQFLSKLREICENIFIPAKMEPAINALENKLEEEVRVNAQLRGTNPEAALRAFHADIESFRRQVVNRQRFIMKELASAR